MRPFLTFSLTHLLTRLYTHTQFVLPEMIAHAFLTLCFLLSFQVVSFLLNAPLLAYNVNKVVNRNHMFDATEIFRTLGQHKKGPRLALCLCSRAARADHSLSPLRRVVHQARLLVRLEPPSPTRRLSGGLTHRVADPLVPLPPPRALSHAASSSSSTPCTA